MVGSDKAVKEPVRMAFSYLYKVLNSFANNSEGLEALFQEVPDSILKKIPDKKFSYEGIINQILKANELHVKQWRMMIDRKINAVDTSSMGRLFDAVSALLDIKREVTFEGEAAIALEAVASSYELEHLKESYPYEILKDDVYKINVDSMLTAIVMDILKENLDGSICNERKCLARSIVAKKFHNTVVRFSIELCTLIRKENGLNRVVLSGGVFQNQLIIEGICEGLESEGFEVFTHGEIPCNDGGVSIGQLIIGHNRFIEGEE